MWFGIQRRQSYNTLRTSCCFLSETPYSIGYIVSRNKVILLNHKIELLKGFETSKATTNTKCHTQNMLMKYRIGYFLRSLVKVQRISEKCVYFATHLSFILMHPVHLTTYHFTLPRGTLFFTICPLFAALKKKSISEHKKTYFISLASVEAFQILEPQKTENVGKYFHSEQCKTWQEAFFRRIFFHRNVVHFPN